MSSGKREFEINNKTYWVREDTACLAHALLEINETIENVFYVMKDLNETQKYK